MQLQKCLKNYLVGLLLFSFGMLPNMVHAQDEEVTLTEEERADSILKANNARRFNEYLQKSNNPSISDTASVLTKVFLTTVKKSPFISLQQYLKGNASGLVVKEESGEPGAEQFMYIRGVTSPVFNKQDLFAIQPVVYVNGIPLSQDNALSYNIQRYDFNRIGSATNALSAIDANNIESIEVLKSPADLAALGPLASNGAIWVTTKSARSGYRQINFETYFGTLQKPSIYTVNGDYENKFRTPYYDKYANLDQVQNKPLYVGNTIDPNFYGASNWTDIYFKSKPVYYIGLGLLGGSDRANFMFNISDTKDRNFDATMLDRYNILFGINMIPTKWLTVSGNVNATRITRERNQSLRDRFAETRFVPDLTNPIAPNKNSYQSFLKKYKGSVDDNVNNSFFGSFSATAKFGKLELISKLSADYEESLRDVFYGKPLMDNNNFLSTYTGFNQRLSINNTAKYHFNTGNKIHQFRLEAGQSLISDFTKYDYVLAYNTPNDFIKIKQTFIPSGSTVYSNSYDVFGYPYADKLKATLSSLHGRIGYSFKQLLDLDFVGRYDGYSNYSEYTRWLFTPVGSARLNLHQLLQQESISTLAIKGSYGIFGKLLQDNRFKVGPQYRVDLGYTDEPTLGSYAGLAGLSQPYSFGWINEYYNWAFSEKMNVGLELGLQNNRYMIGVDYYSNTDKNMLVPVSMPAENGFAYKYVQGMAIANTGINTTLSADLLNEENGINWNLYGSFSWNKNKLVKLPYNLTELVYGNKKIEIGKPVDSYWLYENYGIINSESEVPAGPMNPDGSRNPMSFSGLITFAPGDALWKDVDGNGTIDTKDKVVKGNSLPVYTGGLGSNISYKKFNVDFQFYYALGHQLLNQSTANKLDFINTENSRDITYLKEVTFWQKTFDYNDYPKYNPWSSTIPYRLDQDLFLENAGFLKLRTLSLGYDMSTLKYFSKRKVHKALLYVTGSNLFTISSFKGGDPEQMDYSGTYSGRYLPIPTSYVIGLKLNL